MCCAAAALVAPASAQEKPPRVGENPCIGPRAKELRCPDLVMRRPWGLYTERFTKAGHTVLRAGNVIDSVGRRPGRAPGHPHRPVVHARAPAHLQARWRPHRCHHGRAPSVQVRPREPLLVEVLHAARFELWRVDGEGKRVRKVRTGPKVAYCLRDLTHTRPLVRRSPRFAHYPACSNNSRAQNVTLGTSPGWADLPAGLPGAVDRRDRTARVLRVRAHRRSRERHLRVERGQQRGPGDHSPPVPIRSPATGLPRP